VHTKSRLVFLATTPAVSGELRKKHGFNPLKAKNRQLAYHIAANKERHHITNNADGNIRIFIAPRSAGNRYKHAGDQMIEMCAPQNGQHLEG
jgi:hypothetical protein